jgi:hypothetical protein
MEEQLDFILNCDLPVALLDWSWASRAQRGVVLGTLNWRRRWVSSHRLRGQVKEHLQFSSYPLDSAPGKNK